MKAKYRIRFVPAAYTHAPVSRPGGPVIPNGRQPGPFHVERRTWFGWKTVDRATTLENAELFANAYMRSARQRTRVCKTYDQHGKEIA